MCCSLLFRSPPRAEDVPALVEEGEIPPTHWCTLYREDGSLEVCVGEGVRGGGALIVSCGVCSLSCVYADLSDPTIQVGVFCKKFFICSQDPYG